MRLFVYDMLVNVNGIMYMYVNKCVELSQRVNSAIENVCIIIVVLSPVNHSGTVHGQNPRRKLSLCCLNFQC